MSEGHQQGPRCKTCQAVIELTSDGRSPKFCFECGTALTLVETPVSKCFSRKCPRCGTEYKDRSDGRLIRFCAMCGFKIHGTIHWKYVTGTIRNELQAAVSEGSNNQVGDGEAAKTSPRATDGPSIHDNTGSQSDTNWDSWKRFANQWALTVVKKKTTNLQKVKLAKPTETAVSSNASLKLAPPDRTTAHVDGVGPKRKDMIEFFGQKEHQKNSSTVTALKSKGGKDKSIQMRTFKLVQYKKPIKSSKNPQGSVGPQMVPIPKKSKGSPYEQSQESTNDARVRLDGAIYTHSLDHDYRKITLPIKTESHATQALLELSSQQTWQRRLDERPLFTLPTPINQDIYIERHEANGTPIESQIGHHESSTGCSMPLLSSNKLTSDVELNEIKTEPTSTEVTPGYLPNDIEVEQVVLSNLSQKIKEACDRTGMKTQYEFALQSYKGCDEKPVRTGKMLSILPAHSLIPAEESTSEVVIKSLEDTPIIVFSQTAAQPEEDMDATLETMEENKTPQDGARCVACGKVSGNDHLLAKHYIESHSSEMLNSFGETLRRATESLLSARSSPDQETTGYVSTNLKYSDSSTTLSTEDQSSDPTQDLQQEHSLVNQMDCVQSSPWGLAHQQRQGNFSKSDPVRKVLVKCPKCSILLSREALSDHLKNSNCKMCQVCNQVIKSDELPNIQHKKCLEIEFVRQEEMKEEIVEHFAELDAKRFKRYLICDKLCKKCQCPARSQIQEQVICPKCGKVFSSKEAQIKHDKDDHLNACLSCNINFTSKSQLKRHQAQKHERSRSQQPKDQFSCPLCEYKKSDFACVAKHVRQHFEGHFSASQYSCSRCTMCEFGCAEEGDLYFHMEKHFSNNKDEQTCTLCGMTTRSLNQAWGHARTHRTAYDSPLVLPDIAEPFQCLKCLQEIRSVAEMITHINMHKEAPQSISPQANQAKKRNRKKAFNCPVCEYSCRASEKMKSHIREHFKDLVSASEYNAYMCTICDHGFGQPTSLRMHINAKHFKGTNTAESCHKCGIEITKENALSHFLLHAAEEDTPCLSQNTDPFRCKLCGETERRFEKLVWHTISHRNFQMKTKYVTALTPMQFLCPICESGAFLQKVKLLTHLRTHFKDYVTDTAYSSYVCTICITSCTSRPALHNHVRNAHSLYPGDNKSCQQCGERVEEEDLWKHVLSHQEDYSTLSLSLPEHIEAFQCRLCGGKERSLEKLLAHSYRQARSSRTRGGVAVTQTLVSCLECSINFDTRCQLQHHNASCHSLQQSCIFCEQKFTFVEDLRHHLIASHQFQNESVSGVCTICQRVITSRKESLEHLTDHNPSFLGVMDFTRLSVVHCGLCKLGLRKWEEFLSHGHLSESLFKCVICFDEFSSTELLDEHLKTHISPKSSFIKSTIHVCSCCELVFKSAKSLIEHWRNIHDGEIHCILCCKAFNSLDECTDHIKSGCECIVVAPEPQESICLFCGEKLGTIADILNHSKAHYESALNQLQEKKECHKCFVVLNDTKHAHEHSKEHSEWSAPAIECVICQQRCVGGNRLYSHIRYHFRETKSQKKVLVKCLLCDFEAQPVKLLRHCMNEHNVHAKWEELMALHTHQATAHATSRTNQDEAQKKKDHGCKRRPHKCEYCGTLFSTPQSLDKHREEDCCVELTEERVVEGLDDADESAAEWDPSEGLSDDSDDE